MADSYMPMLIKLDAANSAKLFDKDGKYIKVIKSSSAGATISISLDDGGEGSYVEMKVGDAIRSAKGFDRFYLYNTAQAGESVTLLVTDGESEMEIASRGNIDNITNPVVTKGGNTGSNGNLTVVNGAAAVLLIAASSQTCEWVVKNETGAAGVLWLGFDAAGTIADMFPLYPGESCGMQVTDDLYCRASVGNADARYLKGSKV